MILFVQKFSHEQFIRALFKVASVVSLLAAVGVGAAHDPQDAPVFAAGMVGLVVTAVISLFRLTTGRSFGEPWVVFFCFSLAASLLLADLTLQGICREAWPLFLCCINFLVVAQVKHAYLLGLTCSVSLYVIIIGAEKTTRFGLLDFPGAIPQGQREAYFQRWFRCETLPCERGGDGLGEAAIALVVLLVNYGVACGFAVGMEKERKEAQNATRVVKLIADLLADYDMHAVSQVLSENEEALSQDMVYTLRVLETNLWTYSSYLPQSCFAHDTTDFDIWGDDMDLTTINVADLAPKSAAFADNLSVSIANTRSTNRTDSSTKSVIVQSPIMNRQLCLVTSCATLLVVNIKNALTDDSTELTTLFGEVLGRTLLSLQKKGVVDVFVGDKIHCSFNASKKCSSHGVEAVTSAKWLFFGNSICIERANVGIASGKVLMGEMGCRAMRRFSVFGKLLQEVLDVERVGRAVGSNVVCSLATFKEAECRHRLRLLPLCLDHDLVVADASMCEEDMNKSGSADGEWLYRVGEMQVEWEAFNNSVKDYWCNRDTDRAVAMAGTKAEMLQELITTFKDTTVVRGRLHRASKKKKRVHTPQPQSVQASENRRSKGCFDTL